MIENFNKGKNHFYIIPDYTDENDCIKIVDLFGNLKLLTGSSGLMTELAKRYSGNGLVHGTYTGVKGKALLLSGSCSKMTFTQVEMFKRTGKPTYSINPLDILRGKLSIDDIWDDIKNQNDDVLVYTIGVDPDIRKLQRANQNEISALLENIMGNLASRAMLAGFTRIIVAGGETSGAVIQSLGFGSYMIGPAVAPGIPVMTPAENRSIRIVLKSGNFGQPDFFQKALMTTKGILL